MNCVVAVGGHAGQLVGRDLAHGLRRFSVLGFLFEGAHSGVAVQAFAIVVRGVELDVGGLRNGADVLDVNVAESAELGMESAKHGVVGVAGVAGVIARNQIVLEMRGRCVAGIVDVKAASKIMHDVAGEAELRAGGALHVLGVAESDGHYRQNEECNEGQNFPAACAREFGTRGQQNRERDRDANKKYFDAHDSYHHDRNCYF